MPTSLRILHVDTERGWRGGERQVLWLAAELARRGHHAVVAARAGEPLAARASENGLPVVSCNPIMGTDPLVALALRRVIQREHIDLVHAHTGHAVGLGALATLGSRTPLVASRRVDFPLRRNVVTRWKYGRAHAVLAISRAVADVLASGGMPAAKITIVPSGTDVYRQIEPAGRPTLASLGVATGAPLVVQVAQLVGHKDPVTWVRAVAAAKESVPSIQGLLVGEGPLRPRVEAAIRELGMEGTVHLTGYRADADALLAAADVVVLSSKEEGLGSVLLDALLLGKPIAATRAGGIPEVIEDGRSGLLSPVGDAAALGNAIVRLATDPVLAERLGTEARARAADFSVERTADRTLEVYERVLSARVTGRPSRRSAT